MKKTINNQQLAINNHSFGYSLIEVLIAASLVAVIMIGLSRLFMASLIGEKKTLNLEEVKQNGNYVLAVISDMIRNASEIQGTCSSTQLTILNRDGGTTIFSCSSNRIASNSANLINNSTIQIASCNIFECQETTSKPSLVKINFTLAKGSVASSKEYVSQSFQTTVSLRNY